MSSPRLATTYLYVFGVFGAFFPFIAAWLMELGYSGSAISLLLLVFPVFSLVAPAAMGLLADVGWGRRRVGLLAVAVSFLAVGLVGWATGPVLLTVGLVLLAIGQTPLSPMLDATCLEHVAARGGSYGGFRLFGSLGFLLATLACGPIYDLFPRWGLPAANLVAVAAGAIFLSGLPRQSVVGQQHPVRRLGQALAQPGLPLLALACTLHVASGSGYTLLFVVHLKDLGVSQPMTVASWGWGAGVAAEILLLLVSGRLMARFGGRRLVMLAMVAGIIRWGVTGLATSVPLLVGIQVLHAVYFGAFWVAVVQLVDRLAPPDLKTSMQGVLGAVTFGTGNILGYVLVGPMYDLAGGGGAYLLSAGLAGLGLLLFVIQGGRQRRRRASTDPGQAPRT